MEAFNLRSLDQWQDWPIMTPLVFDVDGADFRACKIVVISDAPVRLYAVTDEDYQPVAFSSGMFEVVFTASETTSLAWFGEKRPDTDGKSKSDPQVRVLTMTRSQMITGDGEASFSVVEPRGSVENLEMRRIQRLMYLNMEKRLAQQMEAMRAMMPAEPEPVLVEAVSHDKSAE